LWRFKVQSPDTGVANLARKTDPEQVTLPKKRRDDVRQGSSATEE
jgi:hypothetical protein